jgi:signal transduction histidine kinase
VPPELDALGAQLGDAVAEATGALDELRETVRGIHPSILAAGGLGAALRALARRSPIPVHLDVRVDGRLPEQVELAAYFVACEALANVSKYAQATSVSMRVQRRNGLATIEIADDGVGGADDSLGSGLRGLADRVEALGGRLRVWTPRGGGTRVQAEIPCA